MVTSQTNVITDLLVQIVATVAGGIFLAFIFFLVRDRFYRIRAFSGLWTFKAMTEKTSYNPYKEMSLFYLVLLIQEGNRLIGTGEKIKEVTSKGTKEYEGKHRAHIQITGFITQRFFKADECVIHITEAGERRTSSTIHNLRIMSEESMEGLFISTIANQTGRVSWSKGNSNYSFSQKL